MTPRTLDREFGDVHLFRLQLRGRRDGIELAPLDKLALAVLEEAFRDYARTVREGSIGWRDRQRRATTAALSAHVFFFRDQRVVPFTLGYCCERLDLDVDYIRRLVARIVPGALGPWHVRGRTRHPGCAA